MKRHGIAYLAASVAVLAAGLSLVASQSDREPPLVDRVRVGAYIHLEGRPYRDPVAPADLSYMEERIGKLDVVHYFFDWGRPFNDAVTSNLDGRDLMLSVQPVGDLVWQIENGQQDAYIDRFAAEARDYRRPVYLRFGHEMNGEWMSYSAGSVRGPDAAEFRGAWRHLVDRFRAQGAANVKYVWSPNESDFPDRAGNHLEDYWPGAEYVDIAGFDAYNWTDAEPRHGDGSNRSFEDMVEGPYQRVAKISAGKEIWLCEFGTAEPGKAAWIQNMFASKRFPRLTALIYFSENDQRDVQRDWRLDSSAEAASAWRNAVVARQTITR